MSDLLFDPKTVKRQSKILTRLLRLIFTRLRITEEDFYKLHYRYESQFGLSHLKIQSNRNNLKKIIRDEEDLSIKKFNHATEDILRLNVLDVSWTFQHPDTGEIFTVSSRDQVSDNGDYHCAPPIVPTKGYM